MNVVNKSQIDRWLQFKSQMDADEGWTKHRDAIDQQRSQTRTEILALIKQFLAGQIPIYDLKEIFDKKTRTDWNQFGLKGLSGAMFLNKLVNHIGDRQTLSQSLWSAVRVPEDVNSGRSQMQSFLDYLDGLIHSGIASKQQLNPGRTPFFLSAFWHLQEPEHWPIFYLSARQVFEFEELLIPANNPITDYFQFRELFNQLRSVLKLSPWELEHLCSWINESNKQKSLSASQTITVPPVNEDSSSSVEEDEGGTRFFEHTEIQLLLAKLGRKLGCNIWIASNDHNKKWEDTKLGDLSLRSLPNLEVDADSQNIIRLIDVLWLQKNNQVAAAFEIEHTTHVYSGLLRMSDLTAIAPNLNFPLYIVIPKERIKKVKKELSRPTFQSLELHKRCGFFTNEELVKNFDAIVTFGQQPSAIRNLASWVEDVEMLQT